MRFLEKIKQNNAPVIMGILNVTPDSFSDGGRYNKVDQALLKTLSMFEDGAAIIDVGGESTRPGALAINADEECQRVLPVIEKIKQNSDVYISVDTSKALVMKEAISLGIHFVNDVCALKNKNALETVAKSNVDICLMHKKGSPKDMQNAPVYDNIIDEITSFFKERIDACNRHGILLDRLCLDPGFGFGKSLDHNYQILHHLVEFSCLKLPILSGTSNKSMIGNLCHADVSNRLGGSLATAIIAVQNKAKILRVHDVFETNQALKVLEKTIQSNN